MHAFIWLYMYLTVTGGRWSLSQDKTPDTLSLHPRPISSDTSTFWMSHHSKESPAFLSLSGSNHWDAKQVWTVSPRPLESPNTQQTDSGTRFANRSSIWPSCSLRFRPAVLPLCSPLFPLRIRQLRRWKSRNSPVGFRLEFLWKRITIPLSGCFAKARKGDTETKETCSNYPCSVFSFFSFWVYVLCFLMLSENLYKAKIKGYQYASWLPELCFCFQYTELLAGCVCV